MRFCQLLKEPISVSIVKLIFILNTAHIEHDMIFTYISAGLYCAGLAIAPEEFYVTLNQRFIVDGLYCEGLK